MQLHLNVILPTSVYLTALLNKYANNTVNENTPYNFNSTQAKANGEQAAKDGIKAYRMLGNYGKQYTKMTPEQRAQRELYINNYIKRVAHKFNVPVSDTDGAQTTINAISSKLSKDHIKSLLPFTDVPSSFRKAITAAKPIVKDYEKSKEVQNFKTFYNSEAAKQSLKDLRASFSK